MPEAEQLSQGYIFSILTPPPGGGEMGQGKKMKKNQAEEKG